MPYCTGIPNSNEDEMHEKGNCKAKLIVSEWKSGLKEVVSDCKCKGRGLMVLLRTARGIKIVHLIIFSSDAPELSSWIISQLGQMVLLAEWSSSNMNASCSCCLCLKHGTYANQRRRNIFMEEITIAKEKGKVIRLNLSQTLLFFSSTVSLNRGRLTKKSKWQTKWIVICVPKHLQVGWVFTIIKRSTMAGGKGTIVASATNHSLTIVVWRPTF